MNSFYFIKLMEHSEELYELLRKRHTAFCLLVILVDRARKVELDLDDGIKVGDAMTGASDGAQYGVTRQVYRSDLKLLIKLGQILTISSTNNGTIVRIINSSIFDISREKQTNQLTNEQPTDNLHPTTKQEGRSEKKYKNIGGDLDSLGFSKPLESRQPYENRSFKSMPRRGGSSAEEVR